MAETVPTRSLERRDPFIIIGFFLTALLIRAYHAVPLVLTPDAALYLSQAKAFLHGEFAFTFMGGEPKVLQPVFPLTAALFSHLFSSLERGATLVAVLFGSLVVVPVFYLSKILYGRRTACIASFLVMVDPLLINFSIVPMSEAVFTFLLILSALLCWELRERRPLLHFILAGMIIGFAYLTRVVGIALMVLPILWILIHTRRQDLLRHSLIRIIALSLGFLMAALPYWFLLHQVFQQWSFTGFYGGVWQNLFRPHPAINGSVENASAPWFLEKYFLSAKMYTRLFFTTISPVVMLFIFLSLIKRWDRFEGLKSGYLFSWIGIFLLVSVLFPPTTQDNFIRYLLPIFPFLFVVSAHGVVLMEEHLLRYAKKRFSVHGSFVKAASLSLILLVLSLSFIPEYQKGRAFSWPFQWFHRSPDRFVFQEIGETMKRMLPPSPHVIARKPFVPYYADAVWYPLSGKTTYLDLRKIMEAGGDYVYLDVFTGRLSPHLAFLLDPEKRPDPFIPILWEKSKTGQYLFILYKVSKP